MKLKALCALIALSLTATAAQAQEYPDNWYVAPILGVSFNDDHRYVDSDETALIGVGAGRLIAPNSSIEFALDYTQRDFGSQFNYVGDSSSLDLTVSLRHFFTDWSWRPYVMGGLGMGFHQADNQFGGNDISGWDPVAQIGVGMQREFSNRLAFRTELSYRADYDNRTVPGESSFGDLFLTAGVLFGVGSSSPAATPTAADPAYAPAEPVVAAAPVSTDGDNDGVFDADDKCPDSAAGEVVGPDGCPQAVVIDLRGVNFEFDKSTLTPASIAILDQAVDVLNRYPAMSVEVAGHTDAIGTDAYNQSLSERRANVVYKYLTDKGIAASRLSGPNGYGESRPIDSNDNADGRARNRRTELVKQK